MQQLKQIINEAEAILITAGSGMGVDSGLPDFRGDDGFWKAYPIAKELNLSFQEMANPIWFITNPPMAWAFYGHRYNLYKNTIPHDGFKILLDLVKQKNDNYFIFTSNVDGQFQKLDLIVKKLLNVMEVFLIFNVVIIVKERFGKVMKSLRLIWKNLNQ